MPYTPFHADWHDLPTADTPITATALEYIEGGIVGAQAIAEAAIAKALVDAKGDLLVASAADTVGREPVGADDAVLTAASGQARGVTWQKINNAMVASNAAITASKLAGYPTDVTKHLAGDGTWVTTPVVPTVGIGTSLPGSPVDGQEFILTDSVTVPTWQWRFRYVAAMTTNKWIFVGGAPLVVPIVGSQSTAATHTTYQNLATAQAFTVPITGWYWTLSTVGYVNSTANPGKPLHGIHYNAVVQAEGMGVTANNDGVCASVSHTGTISTGQVIRIMFKNDTNVAVAFWNRCMTILPQRVGG